MRNLRSCRLHLGVMDGANLIPRIFVNRREEDPGDEVEEALSHLVLCYLESKWSEFPSVFALLKTVSKLNIMQIFY